MCVCVIRNNFPANRESLGLSVESRQVAMLMQAHRALNACGNQRRQVCTPRYRRSARRNFAVPFRRNAGPNYRRGTR